MTTSRVKKTYLLILLLLSLIGAANGCELIAGVDRGKLDGSGEGGSAGAVASGGQAGGTTETQGGTGGVTTDTTSAGGMTGGEGGAAGSMGGSGGSIGGSGGSVGGTGGITLTGGAGGAGGMTTTMTTTSTTTTTVCNPGEVLCPNGQCITCPSAPQIHLAGVCNPGNNTCSNGCEIGWSNCDSNSENGCETQGACPVVSCGPVQLSPAGGWSICVQYDKDSVAVGYYGGATYNKGSLVSPVPPAVAGCVGTEAAKADNSSKPQVYCPLSGATSGDIYDIYLNMCHGDGTPVNAVCTPGNAGTCPVVVQIYDGVVLKGTHPMANGPFTVVPGATPQDSVQLELELP